MTKITFIGAGSTIFMKNIVGDALLTPALADSHFALMDIDTARLAESETVARAMIATVATDGPLIDNAFYGCWLLIAAAALVRFDMHMEGRK